MPGLRTSPFLFCVVVLTLALAFGCSDSRTWEDPSAPLEARVDSLLAAMTLEEKVSQLTSDSAPIERLGVPRYNWWNECLHGALTKRSITHDNATLIVLYGTGENLRSGRAQPVDQYHQGTLVVRALQALAVTPDPT